MAGFVDSIEGLCYAPGGLIFENGIGGSGLTNPVVSATSIYITEDGANRYVTEDGLSVYVTES